MDATQIWLRLKWTKFTLLFFCSQIFCKQWWSIWWHHLNQTMTICFPICYEDRNCLHCEFSVIEIVWSIKLVCFLTANMTTTSFLRTFFQLCFNSDVDIANDLSMHAKKKNRKTFRKRKRKSKKLDKRCLPSTKRQQVFQYDLYYKPVVWNHNGRNSAIQLCAIKPSSIES